MNLNNYRDETGRFMLALGVGEESMSKILVWLDEEMVALKDAVDRDDRPQLRHQIYDVLFLLFELAAHFDLDMDAEWTRGRDRKREKYLAEKKTE